MKKSSTWKNPQNHIQKTSPKTNESIKNSLSFHILKISINKLKLKKIESSRVALNMQLSCVYLVCMR